MKILSTSTRRVLTGVSAFALSLSLAASVHAAVQTFTNAAQFTANLAPGYYQESFDAFNNQNTTSPQTFSSGAFTFTLSDNDAAGIFYSNGTGTQGSVFPSVANAGESFTLSFGAGVTAVGGTFFLTNMAFSPFAGGSITATLADGTSLVLASTGTYGTEPFGGFASTTPITSLTLSAPAQTGANFQFVSLDNLYVGQALAVVPEPSTWMVLAVGTTLLLGGVMRRRVA